MSESVAVIGTINRDTVRLPSGKITRGFGGLLYSLLPLAQLLEKEARIIPLLKLGHDYHRPILKMLGRRPNIITSGIKIVPHKNNHCHLYYLDFDRKSEILEGGVPPLHQIDLRPALLCKLVLINFITGRDLSLRTLESFRRHFGGCIYIDIHSLTLGKRADGRRYLRKPRNWRRYAACADYLQMNRCEFELLTGMAMDKSGLRRFFGLLPGRRPQALIVTLGREGSYLLCRGGRLAAGRQFRVPQPSPAGDTTGCGDIYAAAFCAGLVQQYDLARCAKLANACAQQRVGLAGIETLRFSPL